MAERIEGLSIGLDLDTLALDRGLTGLKDKLKTVNSEMKANMSAFERGDKSIERYETSLMGLNKKLEVQKRVVSEAKAEYEKMVKEFGQGSKEAEKAAREYNNQVSSLNSLQRYINKTENELKELREEQQKSESGWNKFGQTIEKTGTTLTGIGQGLTLGLTTPILGAGLAIGKTASDFDEATGRIEARLGVTKQRAEELSQVAQDVWKNGFAESVREASDAITVVNNNLKDLSDEQLKEATSSAFLLQEAFDAELNESTRAAGQLMKDFGEDSSKAFDLLTWGFQNGLDYTGEFLDTIREYSPQFAEMGYTSEQMLNALKDGFDAGSWSLDKLGDSIKESHLRMTDMSKATKDAYKALGLSAEEYAGKIAKGGKEGNKAFQEVVKKLQGVEDATERNLLATDLFGTQYEDLREKVIFSMTDASKSIKGLEGTTKRASDAIQDNFGTRLTKIWREFVEDIEPVGQTLLDLAEDVLPKIADTVDDVTSAFAEMSPEAQKTALSVGGIAAAAGPTLMVIGGISRGIGALTKVVGPLLSSLGGGKGLTGVLKRIPGPIGAIFTGLGVGTIAFQGYNAIVQKSNEVNLDHVKSLIDQQQSLETLSTKYSELQSKNKLSNDELLRFKDIQSELKTAKSSEEIKALKDEAENLKKESGLTNDEFEDLLKLNDDIIKKTPEVEQSFSARGNAIIKNKDALDEVNTKLRENIALELENQRDKNSANLDKNIRAQITALEELKAAEKELSTIRTERDEKEQLLLDLKKQKKDAINAGDKLAITTLENEILLEEGNLANLNTEYSTRSDIVAKKQESLNQAEQELTKTQKLYDELINLQLAQVGINEKGAEGITQLDLAISKGVSRQKYLSMLKDTQGGLNEKQEEELKNLDQSLSKYNSARTAIEGMQNEQEEVNQKIREGTGEAEELTKEADKDVTKNVKVDDKGGAKKVSTEAGKNAKKNVNVTDNGDNRKIQKDAEKKANKGVKLSLLNSLSSLLPSAVNIGVNLIGKLSGIGKNADGTKNWRGGLTWVGEEGPELMYLPNGTRIIPNEDSMSLLKKWNIPTESMFEGFATGGLINTSGLYSIAEGGWPEFVIPTDPNRRTDAMKLLALAGKQISGNKRPNQLPNVNATSDSSLNKKVEELTNLVKDLINIQQEQLVAIAAGHTIQMNDRTVGTLVEPHVTEIQKRKGKVESKFKRR